MIVGDQLLTPPIHASPLACPVQSPWQALPAEAMRGITFALFWAGSTYYVYNASPPGLTATMLSILNAMYGGLGQSIGSLIGGWMSTRVGISRTFLLCGAADLVCLKLFLAYSHVQHRADAAAVAAAAAAGKGKKKNGRPVSGGKAGGEGVSLLPAARAVMTLAKFVVPIAAMWATVF